MRNLIYLTKFSGILTLIVHNLKSDFIFEFYLLTAGILAYWE